MFLGGSGGYIWKVDSESAELRWQNIKLERKECIDMGTLFCDKDVILTKTPKEHANMVR